MISTIVSRLVILVFGTLYPAYASYKAVRTKNVKEYVKWMMYWIVFALFTCAETFTDVFLSWFPFYYEIKIILVLWLLSPATKGSSILYRKFVHPMLSRREQEIDDYIAKAKEQGYHTVLNLGTKGVNYATTVIMQTAIKGGGGIVNQLRKSYSLSDLTDEMDARADARGLQGLDDEASDVVDPRHVRRRRSPRRSASGSSRVDMYFPEVDVRPGPSLGHVRSTEDVSSGYSSAEPLYVGQPPKLEAREGLVRTASVGGASRPRTRTTRTSLNTKKATTLPEDSEGSESEDEITIIQKISKSTQLVKRTIIVQEDGDSSGNEFVDTIGFPAESIPQKVREILEITDTIEPAQKVNITCDVIETKVELYPEKIQKNVEESIEIKKELIEIPLDTNESAQEMNITCDVIETKVEFDPEKIQKIVEESIQIKKELIEISSDISEPLQEVNITCDVIETKVELDPEKIQVNEESMQIKKELSVDIFEDSLETNESDNKIELTNESSPEGSVPVESIQATSPDIDLISLTSLSQRGGKYNKYIAPPPPPIKTENESEIFELAQNTIEPNIYPSTSSEKLDPELSDNSETIYEDPYDSNYSENMSFIPETVNEISESHKSIKATLVLKPGIIKNIGPPTDDSNKTPIFISQSPKVKRKSQSPITKLMMLPKKIFGSSNENLKVQRKSWHSETTSLTPSSEDLKSKSDTEDLYEPVGFSNEKMSVSSTDITDKKHEENKIILRNLSHSPKQYRRRSKKEDYDYDDSD